MLEMSVVSRERRVSNEWRTIRWFELLSASEYWMRAALRRCTYVDGIYLICPFGFASRDSCPRQARSQLLSSQASPMQPGR